MVGLDVRIPVRLPFDAARMTQFLAFHLVPGIESAGDGWYTRSLRLPHGYGVVRLDLADAASTGLVRGRLTVSDVRDVGSATERCRRLLDAGCDPDAVAAALGDDPVVGGSLRSRPGLRAPGHVDGDEIALRTVLGQQVSLKAANRLGGVLVERAGDDLPEVLHRDGVTRVFPTAAQVAALPGDAMPMPRSRQVSLGVLATALAARDVVLDRSAGRPETRARLLALKGIGPWTADYVLMRALGDPDVFLPGDVAVRAVLAEHDVSGPEALASFADRVSPWRSYAVMHLWAERLDALARTTRTGPHPARGPPMSVPDRTRWTEVESPVGPLRLVAHDGALSAVEFLGEMPDGPGEAASVRVHAARAAAGGAATPRRRGACGRRGGARTRRRAAGGLLRPASGPTSTCPWRPTARPSSRRCGRRCARSPTAPRRRTARSPRDSAEPGTALEPSGWPTVATRSP